MPVERWRWADPSDAAALSVWTCTDPAKAQYVPGRGKAHPRPWELEVQSFVRTARERRDGLTLLGVDPEGIAAVAHLRETPELAPEPGVRTWLIAAVARAQRLAGTGVGDEALGRCLALAADPRSPVRADVLLARIDPGNAPSCALFARHGFEHLDDDGGMQLWGRIVGTPEAGQTAGL